MGSLGDVKIVTLDKFKLALYVIISPSPENDVQNYMSNWVKKSGLLDYPDYTPRMIGWDFPFVSDEQKNTFKLRGYVSAMIIPDDFTTEYGGVEYAYCDKDTYAMLTITDPHSDSFGLIPKAYCEIFKYTDKHGITVPDIGSRLIFEEEYDRDGVHYMDVYIPVNITDGEE